MSLLRLVRLIRLIRLLRLFKMFKELVLLVMGFIDALRVLVWIFLLLGMVIYSTSILVVFQVRETCSEYAGGEFDDCVDMFGGIVETMYTLFQVNRCTLHPDILSNERIVP